MPKKFNEADLQGPALHVTYEEALFYARVKGQRLPTHFEWLGAAYHALRNFDWTSVPPELQTKEVVDRVNSEALIKNLYGPANELTMTSALEQFDYNERCFLAKPFGFSQFFHPRLVVAVEAFEAYPTTSRPYRKGLGFRLCSDVEIIEKA